MATKRNPVGFEIVERYDLDGGTRATIMLWAGDFNRQIIRDRQTNAPAVRRAIARTAPSASGRGYAYVLTAAGKGGWRHGWAKDYEAALDVVNRWVQRRFEVAK